MPEHVNCNLCGEDRPAPYLETAGYRLVKCANCGLVYMNPRPSAAELSALYSDTYFTQSPDRYTFDYLRDEKQLHYTARHRLRDIERYAPKGKLLEIGCALGYLLDAARQAGWPEVYGLEPSEFASTYAREKLGLPVITGGLEEAQAALSRDFDVVAMYHVIEHLPDPLAQLKIINQLMGANGLLVLETPNVASWAARLKKEKWAGFAFPEHIYFFSPLTLKQMLAQAHFQVVDTKTSQTTELLRFTKTMGLWGLRAFISRNLRYFYWIKRLYILIRRFLNLDDAFLVYARKTGTCA